ncbi:MAG: glycoside hydrolase family 3 C-terminal domain-containing protein [Candidatus Latescibacterota bacterium]
MSQASQARYLDPDLPAQERARDLVGRMTLEEKVSQMVHAARAIPRLGVPEYNWWNECLHGVGRAGAATVFPQAIGMAASFAPDLVHQVATAISDEARAKYHQALRQDNRGWYFGLTFWSPNVNLFRDPRWGRGQETYGEDPYLSGRLGVAFVRGLQGDDPHYLKVVATPKHLAVHSGPEPLRHHFDARVSPRDLRETYLPAFRACVQEGRAFSVMGAYNRTNGEPCCASSTLLGQILRGEWGFEGYVVSDCGAIADIHARHRVASSPAGAAALAVRNGCDLNCGDTYLALLEAADQDLIDEATIDQAVVRLFTARFRLGMFDPEERVPYARIPPTVVASPAHRALARRMAQASMVMLRNEGHVLPLRADLRSLAVIGPAATSLRVLLGNYYGYPTHYVTPFAGIVRAVSPGTQIHYAEGCKVRGGDRRGFAEAVRLASQSEAIIAVFGYSPELEGEEGDVDAAAGDPDRQQIGLPGVQEELILKLAETGKPLVLVLTGGSPIALGQVARRVPGILLAWYPGEEGGSAIADVVFGHVSPAGQLPVTFVHSLEQVPPFDDYRMQGRTYRFLGEEPLYRFGYGLSYTTFEYGPVRLGRDCVGREEEVEVSVSVTNTGGRASDEVVQLYVSDLEASVPVPRLHLEGVHRIHLKPGEHQTVGFTLRPEQLAAYDDEGRPFVEPGEFRISVGGGQPPDPAARAQRAVLTVHT